MVVGGWCDSYDHGVRTDTFFLSYHLVTPTFLSSLPLFPLPPFCHSCHQFTNPHLQSLPHCSTSSPLKPSSPSHQRNSLLTPHTARTALSHPRTARAPLARSLTDPFSTLSCVVRCRVVVGSECHKVHTRFVGLLAPYPTVPFFPFLPSPNSTTSSIRIPHRPLELLLAYPNPSSIRLAIRNSKYPPPYQTIRANLT